MLLRPLKRHDKLPAAPMSDACARPSPTLFLARVVMLACVSLLSSCGDEPVQPAAAIASEGQDAASRAAEPDIALRAADTLAVRSSNLKRQDPGTTLNTSEAVPRAASAASAASPSSGVEQPADASPDGENTLATTRASPRSHGHYGERDDVRAWAQDLAERDKLDAPWVLAALSRARYQAGIARAVLPAPVGTPKNWTVYRSRFVEPKRIKAAHLFWQANQAWLTQAQQRYGVPQEIIVGLLGVETLYGKQIGTWRVLDALSTLAFDYPQAAPRDRSAFFRAELEQFLILCSERNTPPHEPLGSYAGAIGLPQFMPSSWRRWAIDFDGDGQIDLWHSPADAIGSVANYLAAHGWQRDEPTHYPVQIPKDGLALAQLLEPDIRPSFSASAMRELGAVLPEAAFEHSSPLALVKLENGQRSPQYVAGTLNFYAITRYNQSSLYAMAVIELGAAALSSR